MDQQTVQNSFSLAADSRERIRNSFRSSGNPPQKNSSAFISKKNELKFIPLQEGGYSLRANCDNYSGRNCVTNFNSGNPSQKNNNTYLEPQITFKVQTLGALSNNYFRTPNIF